MQLGWNDEIIFPAVAAHGKARKIGELASEHTENLSFLFWKTRILYGYELISEARSLFSTEFLIFKNTKSLFRNKDVNDQSRSGLSDG